MEGGYFFLPTENFYRGVKNAGGHSLQFGIPGVRTEGAFRLFFYKIHGRNWTLLIKGRRPIGPFPGRPPLNPEITGLVDKPIGGTKGRVEAAEYLVAGFIISSAVSSVSLPSRFHPDVFAVRLAFT